MKRFVEGEARDQGGLFPAHLEDFIGENNPVRAVDAFVEMLDLRKLGFSSVDPPGDRTSELSPGDPPEALCLRLSQRYSLEPPART